MYTPKRGDEPQVAQAPLIPPVAQPAGLRFFLETWTGRIIVANTLVFLATVFSSHNFGVMAIDLDILLRFGAKDPVLLAKGEYWRLLTPMFIHGGLLHFALNNWALYVIGFQLEHMLRPLKFMSLYLLAGIGGSVASSLTSLMPSVGASGALFGLLGCGFYVERTIQSRIEQMTGYKPRIGAYTGMVVANILFGFIIPQIDNAAHIGGLLVGVTFAYVMLRLKPNRLIEPQRTRARIAAGFLSLAMIAGGAVGSSSRYVLYRLQAAVLNADQIGDRYYYLNRLLELAPEALDAHLHRLTLALRLRDFSRAQEDLGFLAGHVDYQQNLTALEGELRRQGYDDSADWLKVQLMKPLQRL